MTGVYCVEYSWWPGTGRTQEIAPALRLRQSLGTYRGTTTGVPALGFVRKGGGWSTRTKESVEFRFCLEKLVPNSLKDLMYDPSLN